MTAPPLVGRLWDALDPQQRLAIATLQPYGDLSGITRTPWNEIDPRDRARLMSGFRHLMGLGSCIESVLQ